MAVKLRLTRIGKKKQPQYRIVVADSRSPRDGRFIEILGHYDPRQDPSVLTVDNDKAVKWLADGAQPTERVAKLRGAAVSPAVDSMCTLCHLKLRPQMWVDLKKNDQVMQCPGCSRILYYEAPVPEVHPQP